MAMNDSLGIADQISFSVTKETKIVREGKVGVLYSSEYGSGWYTWHNYKDLLTDPEVVHLVDEREKAPEELRIYFNEKIVNYCERKYPGGHWNGVGQLAIEWIPLGTIYRVCEYDGKERIELQDDIMWLTA